MSTETPETSPLPPYTSNIIKTLATMQKASNTAKTTTQNFWTTLTSDKINMTLFYIGFIFMVGIIFLFQLYFFINNIKPSPTTRFPILHIFFLCFIFLILGLIEGICAFKILRVVQTYTKEEEPSTDGIFFVSRPSDTDQIRSSIKEFIETAQEESPSILDYNPDTNYVYINKNFENVLLATRVGKVSGLQQDMDKIFTVYTYVPVAIIVNDDLVNLSGKPFLQKQMESNE